MPFLVNSKPIQYSDHYFNTDLELTWFIFLEELQVSKDLISSEPFYYNQGVHYHPSLRFSFNEISDCDIFGIIKPVNAGEFRSALTLYDYIYGDRVICVLGNNNESYLLFRQDTRLSNILDHYFGANSMLWSFCVAKVEDVMEGRVRSDHYAFEANNMTVTYKKPGS